MTEGDLRLLLARKESDLLDFKREFYDLTVPKKKADFLEDVCAMANTPRDTPGYLVFGVESPAAAPNVLHGVASHPDDANLQNVLDDYLRPTPRLSYERHTVDGKAFGVVSIMPDRLGPVLAVRDVLSKDDQRVVFLRKRQCWCRRGSRNTLADTDDLLRLVRWIDGGRADNGADTVVRPTWRAFLDATENLSPKRNYLLLSPPNAAQSGAALSGLDVLPWSAVFDMNPASETTGLHAAIGRLVANRRGLHLVAKGDRPTFTRHGACYWFFLRGIAGRASTIFDGEWRQWKVGYGAELKEAIRGLAHAIVPAPTTCIVLDGERKWARYANDVLGALLEGLGDSLTVICVGATDSEFFDELSDFTPVRVNLPVEDLAQGLGALAASTAPPSAGGVQFPGRSGQPVIVPASKVPWLEEGLELIHLSSGRSQPVGSGDLGAGFLRGREPTWYELELHLDVERDAAFAIQRRLVEMLQSARTLRFNLYHHPGAGGTTLARRIVWNLHREHPTIRIRAGAGSDTVEKIADLYGVVARPLLVLVEGSDVVGQAVDDTFEALRQRHIPAVFVHVLRRAKPQQQHENAAFLSGYLTADEHYRFVGSLSRDVPARASALAATLTATHSSERTVFFLGLTAYLDGFRGIDPYVRVRLEQCTERQVAVVCMLSLCAHYSQRGVLPQVFADELENPPDKVVQLSSQVPSDAMDLLIVGEDGWARPLHDLVAQKIVETTLGRGSPDGRLWRQRLSDWGIRLAKALSRGGEDELETARRVFVFRDNDDVLGTERSFLRHYSQFLEEIDSKEGRKVVLMSLCECFPIEAHFWGHLGRLCAFELRDYVHGLLYVERALALEPGSGVLFHMRGMIHRRRLSESLADGARVSDIVADAQAAVEAFARSRELLPDREHGFVSEIQMRCEIMDRAARPPVTSFAAYALSSDAEPFVRECGEISEALMEQLASIRGNRERSQFEVDCRAKLDRIYKDTDAAIQAWSELLNRPGVFRPPVRRQLIWTYLAKHEGAWRSLKGKHVRKILGLLQDNLDEEPGNDRDLRLWIRAIRFQDPPEALDRVVEKVGYWRANSGGIDALYYLYVLRALQAIEGSRLAVDESDSALRELRARTRARRNNRLSFEWLGAGTGLRSLVHHSELGPWNEDVKFWTETRPLARIGGRIVSIDGWERGEIELGAGVRAFFSPGTSDIRRNRDENKVVTLHLGFSYDGPRAWSVALTT